ncbi:AAA family ATPase [bacterium]|nr:AAA family ATPase [bacterium]MBU1985069.1 AAA family ATPase [bacterium]
MPNPPPPEKLREEITEFLRSKYGPEVAVTELDLGAPHEGTATTPPAALDQIDFKLKPSELEAYLEQYVLHQKEAVEILATKICTHFHRRKWELDHAEEPAAVGRIKSNILMIGPTGVGKTYLVKLIADKIGVPFVKGDATKFSETGYVGGDVDDLVRGLVREAKGDVKLAEYGLIYVDEIDKIASSGSHWGPDVSRTGVQRALLKLMEDTDVDLRTPHDLASQMEAVIETQRTGKAERKKISTRNMLFIVSGAFGGLADIIRRRLAKGTMGFRHGEEIPQDNQEIIRRVTTSDLLDYGFESEFVGRLPVVAQLQDLSEGALFDVLKSPYSAVTQGKKQDFASYGIELEFEDDALLEIARRAHQAGIGARGLTSVMEKSLIRFEKMLPSSGVKKLVITHDLILDPEAAAAEILTRDAVQQFQRKFLEKSGLVLEFPAESVEWVRARFGGDPSQIIERLTKTFGNYEYGMKLAGSQNLRVTPDLLEAPDTFLDRMIKKVYEEKEKK